MLRIDTFLTETTESTESTESTKSTGFKESKELRYHTLQLLFPALLLSHLSPPSPVIRAHPKPISSNLSFSSLLLTPSPKRPYPSCLITTFIIIRPRTKPCLPSPRTIVLGKSTITRSSAAASKFRAVAISVVGAAGAETGGDGPAAGEAGLGVAAAVAAGSVGGG